MIKKTISTLLCIALVLMLRPALHAESTASQDFSFGKFTNCSLADVKELEQFMDITFKTMMEKYHIPGAVVSVVKDGKSFFSKGYGYADIDKKIPASADGTVFPICSVTKLFTADAVMQLYEAGKIDLDSDVNKYLKSFKLKNPYSRPVTVRQLLTHTSGIDDQRIGDLTAVKPGEMNLTRFLSRHMLPVVREPGRHIVYGSYETALAGCLVEEITGISYEKYIYDKILIPSGMDKSSLSPDIAGLGTPYRYENGKYAVLENPGYMNISPAGAIMSTADDMARYMLAHLEGSSKTILNPSTLKLMFSRQAYPDSRLPGIALGFYDKVKDGRRALQHDGAGMGYLTKLCLFPESNTGIYIAVNQGDNWATDEILDEFIDRYFPVTSGNKTEANIIPLMDYKARAHNYTGTYRFMEHTVGTFDKCSVFPYGEDIEITENNDGTLSVRGIGPAAFFAASSKLVEVEPMLFKKLDAEGYVSFETEKNGGIRFMADSSNSYHGTYEKLEWYELPAFQIVLLCTALLLFLITAVMSLISFIRRRIKKTGGQTASPSRFIAPLSTAISIINLAFMVIMLYTFTPDRLRYGVPFDSKLLFCAPVISLIMTCLLLVLVVNEYRIRQLSIPKRIYFTLAGIAAAAFIWWVNFWNLIGFRY